MSSRAVAIAASKSAAAADSSTSVTAKRTTKTYTYKTDSSGNVSTEVHTHVDSSSDQSHVAMRRLEERIAILEEDLGSEQHLRKRIEREKHDLQLQIIALSERLTESDAGAETQLDINRKREAEMAKLRKLLEDVHMESEQQIHILRKKHQEAMMELQEQIQSISISKEKVVKEKSKMQSEIAELIAKIEILTQEKTSIRKVVEKLEIQVHEYNVKIESLNKAVVEVTSQKTCLAQENAEVSRRLNEMRHAIETAGLDKNKVASQLKDLQTNLDNLERAKGGAENRVRALEHQLKTITMELEEQRTIRIELEHQLNKLKEDGGEWRKRYENEARLRIEDVDNLKKKFGVQIAELTDMIDATNLKLKGVEQQKVKLTQEVQVLIKEVEVSQVTIKELNVKLVEREKRSEELAIKLREMTNLFEKADHDNKVRAQEVVRLGNELDRAKMDNDLFRRDNGKLSDEARGFKAEVDALKKRLHEVEQENRKLAHDREELARAFKDADGGRAKAEARVIELENELRKLRTDADAKIRHVEEESNVVKKKLLVEIESLTVRLQETESRLRNEVEKMKKKMAVTIHELEMSLDAANKNNVQLQNSSKQQATRILELTGALEGTNKKLQATVEQYNAATLHLTIIEKESNQMKTALDQALNAKKISESKIVELTARLTEVTNINVTINAKVTKIEKELQSISADYADIARELKLADDRANKAAHDAQYCEGLLREEQAKVVKSETARKALETEVRSLTVRMEEIETSSIASSKRTIQKMELRIEELETLLEKEKKLHVETTTQLHKRDRSFKELLLQSEEDRKNILILQESLDRLNEKIKMYKRQLEEQESISNSNIMRVKKFQRELEAAESRASDAESCLNSFRSRQRVFAAAESRKESVSDEVEREVVIKKTVHNVNATNVSDSYTSASHSEVTSSAAAAAATSSSTARSALATSSYSRAGSMARASMSRAMSVGRAGSVYRY